MKKFKKQVKLFICDHANKNDCDSGSGCDHNIHHIPFIEDGDSEKCNVEIGHCMQTLQNLDVRCISVKIKGKTK